MGLADERGSLRPGLSADLILVDVQKRVVETWIAGEAKRVSD
jgi:N-acetylglucosamine-6-phosphate deacetylase